MSWAPKSIPRAKAGLRFGDGSLSCRALFKSIVWRVFYQWCYPVVLGTKKKYFFGLSELLWNAVQPLEANLPIIVKQFLKENNLFCQEP